MPPGTRRANRGGYAEHDDFEGLPVRQWRYESIQVTPPAPQESIQKGDIWDIELPYGMPKDAHLLPPHSQELLRAARSGRLYKRPLAAEEEEVDADALIPEAKEKKEEDTATQGFAIKVWKQLPRNGEGPTISHLAKRRKGTVTIASKTPEDKIQGPTVTRATVRRIDAAGNPYTEEVTLNENQQVEGEIISTRVEAVSAAVAESLNTPVAPRRRPPIPKRKFKPGPGRGKKKIKMQATEEGQPSGGTPAAGGAAVSEKKEGEEGARKLEGTETPNPDSEVAEGDDNDNDDDDNDDDDGDDGDEREGEESAANTRPERAVASTDKAPNQDMEMADATPAITQPAPAEGVDTEMMDGSPTKDNAIPSPMSLAPPLASLATGSPKIEGSPLKNVSVASPPPEISAPVPLLDGSLPAGPPEVDDKELSGSVVAEPPSTIVGEAPAAATERDVPTNPALELQRSGSPEALLPPPPDQVGKIETPVTEEGAKEFPVDAGDKAQERPDAADSATQRPPLSNFNSTVSAATDDSIKPDDSASVSAPLNDSTQVSDGGTAAAPPPEEMDVDSAAATVVMKEEPAVPEPTTDPSPPPAVAPESAATMRDGPEKVRDSPKPQVKEETDSTGPAAAKEEPDIMGGLLGELDKQDSGASQQQASDTQPDDKPESDAGDKQEEDEAPAPEAVAKKEDVPEPTLDTAPKVPTPPAAAEVSPPAAPTEPKAQDESESKAEDEGPAEEKAAAEETAPAVD